MPQSVISASAHPNSGRDGRAPAQGGIIATLIESARRQETLIDALTAAVESGKEPAILQAARELAANRRRDTPAPDKKRGRKPKELAPEM
jgi:hypothetical protein